MSVNKDTNVSKDLIQNLAVIEQSYPIIKTTSNMSSEFLGILRRQDPDKLDDFLKKYNNSIISNFCKSIKRYRPSQKHDIFKHQLWIC